MLLPKDLVLLAYLMCLSRRRLAHLVLMHRTEIDVLKRRLRNDGRRIVIRTTVFERLRLFLIARRLGDLARRHIMIVSPDTLVRWMKEFAVSLWNLKCWWGRIKMAVKRWLGLVPKLGRPRLRLEIVRTVLRVARDNPHYGIGKIRGVLFKLDLPVSREAIRRILRKHMPERFLRQTVGLTYAQLFFGLREGFHAMDFFSLISQFGQQIFCFFIVDHATRRCVHFAATVSPSPVWIMEQVRLAYGDNPVPEALISDNDRNFSYWFSKKLKEELGVRHHRNTVASPWENGVAERFVRTVREEVFDRLPPMFGSRQAERIMAEYLPFYNERRPHLTLDFAAPAGPVRESRSSSFSFVERVPLFHGLWNDYRWSDLAVLC